MKEVILKIYDKVGIRSQRTRNITKHVGLSALYKGGSVVANLLLVPITINYLDSENYGVWLTLSSFVAWFSFFDIGLGQGLRNKFTEAKATGNVKLARGYVSTAYFTISLVSSCLLILFLGLNFLIDWTKFFNTNNTLQSDLSILMPLVFGFFCLQLVVKLITTIYTADLHHSMQGKISFLVSVLSLLSIWFLTFTSKSSILIFGVIISSMPVLILTFLNLYAFSGDYKELRPIFSLWKIKYLKDIFGLGVSFFFIQMAGIIMFSTDNMIITQLFGPTEVVPYNIAFKYFSISNMILLIILTPYWSSITEAYNKKDYDWIKQSMKSLIRITFVSVILLFIMFFLSQFAYSLWIGDKVKIPFFLSLTMAIYFIWINLYLPYTYFINGTGKIKIQLISVIFGAIINIPLSIFLAQKMNLGVAGIIMATTICLIPHGILSPIQYSKIINGRAIGIWNK